MNDQPRRSPWIRLLLVLVPAWLIGSGAAALWYYFHLEKKQAEAVQERFAQNVSVPLLTDDLKKIVEVIGERNSSSEAAGTNLSRTASMIEGLLGPGNTGYVVAKIKGPATWPILQVTIQSKNAAVPAVWVLTSYDSRSGSRGAETNATGLASTLAAAQALASDQPNAPHPLHFLPHINDPESPVLETVTKLSEQIKSHSPPKAILCVEAMGAGESLWLSSHNTAAAPPNLVADIGKVYGTEIIYQEDKSDLSSTLCEMNLPAVRIATRALLSSDEKDDQLPFAPTVAASTGRLVELIRRCAQ
ncbi:MAG: hypothetical protein HC845_03200 [Akkermansiaceae bacterium]|nr:hypothetical protein [Akkermansiaceae bacterium]